MTIHKEIGHNIWSRCSGIIKLESTRRSTRKLGVMPCTEQLYTYNVWGMSHWVLSKRCGIDGAEQLYVYNVWGMSHWVLSTECEIDGAQTKNKHTYIHTYTVPEVMLYCMPSPSMSLAETVNTAKPSGECCKCT